MKAISMHKGICVAVINPMLLNMKLATNENTSKAICLKMPISPAFASAFLLSTYPPEQI